MSNVCLRSLKDILLCLDLLSDRDIKAILVHSDQGISCAWQFGTFCSQFVKRQVKALAFHMEAVVSLDKLICQMFYS